MEGDSESEIAIGTKRNPLVQVSGMGDCLRHRPISDVAGHLPVVPTFSFGGRAVSAMTQVPCQQLQK